MKIICTGKTNGGFTIGKIYEAISDSSSHMYHQVKDIDSIELFTIINDKNEPCSFNLSSKSGAWMIFEILDLHRQNKLELLGI
jgi:hypothetical protein